MVVKITMLKWPLFFFSKQYNRFHDYCLIEFLVAVPLKQQVSRMTD